MERRFSEESERKHQAWLDAGKPLNKEGAAMLDTGAATPGQKAPAYSPARWMVSA